MPAPGNRDVKPDMAEPQRTPRHAARAAALWTRRHLAWWVLAATAVNAAVITQLAELLARPGQPDSAIDGWIWISLIPLALSVIFPIAGHAVEERDKAAERKGEQQLADKQAQLMPASDSDSPPRAVRVADEQPRRFGVHRPIEVAGATSD